MLNLQSKVVIKRFPPFSHKQGTIQHIERIYRPVDQAGKFLLSREEIFESSFYLLEFPFSREENFIVLKIPDKLGNITKETQVYKFFGYIYVVRISSEIIVCLPERNLQVI